eukprot:2678110-Prymnesium_polylepis.1
MLTAAMAARRIASVAAAAATISACAAPSPIVPLRAVAPARRPVRSMAPTPLIAVATAWASGARAWTSTRRRQRIADNKSDSPLWVLGGRLSNQEEHAIPTA